MNKKNRKNNFVLIDMSKRGVRCLIAFILGQVIQLILHGTCFNYWQQYQIPFCIAGGFLVVIAVLAGVIAANGDKKDEITHYEDMQ